MRISDWSSDVCSSDLQVQRLADAAGALRLRLVAAAGRAAIGVAQGESQVAGIVHPPQVVQPDRRRPFRDAGRLAADVDALGGDVVLVGRVDVGRVEVQRQARSEEHTSELQSLMRISYAVFCLKKKKKT